MDPNTEVLVKGFFELPSPLSNSVPTLDVVYDYDVEKANGYQQRCKISERHEEKYLILELFQFKKGGRNPYPPIVPCLDNRCGSEEEKPECKKS